MPPKGSSFWVFAWGCLALVAGIMNVGFDLYDRAKWLVPRDMGLVVGEGAFLFMGLLAIIVGQSLRKIEKRLDEIEVGRH
jgi:hypothetical protein